MLHQGSRDQRRSRRHHHYWRRRSDVWRRRRAPLSHDHRRWTTHRLRKPCEGDPATDQPLVHIQLHTEVAAIVAMVLHSLRVAEHRDPQIPRHVVSLQRHTAVSHRLHVPARVVPAAASVERAVRLRHQVASVVTAQVHVWTFSLDVPVGVSVDPVCVTG